MRKNGSRLISLRQYKLTDLFLFAVILVVAEVIVHFATVKFSGETVTYLVTFTVPVTMLVMVRWGWVAVFYAVADGVLWCLLKGAAWQSYLCYALGNAFVALLLLMTKFVGKSKISDKWYLSVLFVVCGWLSMMLGRSLLGLCVGYSFSYLLKAFCLNELLSLCMAVIIIAVLRKFDGMFEDQKTYLLRLDKERRDKMRPETFGNDYVEIDDESMSILKKWDDGLN